MSQKDYTTNRRGFQHLTREKRAQIEILMKQKVKKTDIAKAVGISRSTLYNELKRGTVEQIDTELRPYNSQHKKDAFSDISALTEKIADKTLDQLEREGVFVFPEYIDDAEDIIRDQMILQSVNDSYCSGNVMGFIGCGNERLIIESRFSGEENDFFFQYLLIYPDFISRDNEAQIIVDAKYKLIDNIGNRDYLQVLAYMFRFDAKAGFYLYPEAEGLDDLKLRMNQGSTYESNVMPRDDISITKHGLKIPADAADYDGFAARMRINEQEFIRVFTQ